MDDELRHKAGRGDLAHKFGTSSKPVVTVDVERYQAYLDGSNMSDAQKEEFLQSLWEIIVGFVELGFGVHPLQEVCGKDASETSRTAKIAEAVINSEASEKPNKSKDFSP